MKGGVIGSVDGDFDRVESVNRVRTEGGEDLRMRLDHRGIQQTPDGLLIETGCVAKEYRTSERKIELDGAGITETTEDVVETRYTEYLTVPGEFVVVPGKRGTFAFDLIGDVTGTEIERCAFDMDGYMSAHPDAEPWKVGFYGHDEFADNGVIHGKEVLRDEVFGTPLEETEKNQLGLEFEFDGEDVKMTITESGYVEVYRPTNFETVDFAEFVREDVLELGV